MQTNNIILIATWNGVDKALQWIDFNAEPNFKLVLFNYSGNNALPLIEAEQNGKHYHELISTKTEFKGRILAEVYHHYKNQSGIEYIGIVDDDIQISIADINTLIETAHAHKLDAFQAAVHPESYYSHAYNVHQPGKTVELVDWVEIMFPFYRKELFDAAHPFYTTYISSYGIDNFAIPYYQQLLSLNKAAVIHTVSMKHLKPVTDGSKIFSNGLTARTEGEKIRKKILTLIKAHPAKDQLFPPSFQRKVYQLNQLRLQALKYRLKELLGIRY